MDYPLVSNPYNFQQTVPFPSTAFPPSSQQNDFVFQEPQQYRYEEPRPHQHQPFPQNGHSFSDRIPFSDTTSVDHYSSASSYSLSSSISSSSSSSPYRTITIKPEPFNDTTFSSLPPESYERGPSRFRDNGLGDFHPSHHRERYDRHSDRPSFNQYSSFHPSDSMRIKSEYTTTTINHNNHFPSSSSSFGHNSNHTNHNFNNHNRPKWMMDTSDKKNNIFKPMIFIRGPSLTQLDMDNIRLHINTNYSVDGPKVHWNKDLMPLPLRPFPGIRQRGGGGGRGLGGQDRFRSDKTRSGKKRGTEGTGDEPLPLSDYGFGFHMVRRLGWDPSMTKGLGKSGHGIITPVNVQLKTDRLGLITSGERTADGRKAPQDAGPKKKKPPGARASERRRLARRKAEKELGLVQGAFTPANTPPKEGALPGTKKQRRAVTRRLRKEERLGLPAGALKGAGMLAPKHLKRLLRGDSTVWDETGGSGGGGGRRRRDDLSGPGANFTEVGPRRR